MTGPGNGGRGADLEGGLPPDRPQAEPACRRSSPLQRSAVDSIEEATAEARAGGHNLAGFVRRCNSAGYGFFARCRTCRIEVGVHRTAAGWAHMLEHRECAGGPSPNGRPR